MDLERFRALYKYNRWANGRILEVTTNLTAEQFTKNLGSSYPSIHDPLVHILSAEWVWLKRWKGVSPKEMLEPKDFPTIAQVKDRWSEVERERGEFINLLTEDSLDKVIGYMNTKGGSWKYPLWQMLQHLVNHSTHHRGQVVTMLRQLRISPPATDFLVYYDVHSGHPEDEAF